MILLRSDGVSKVKKPNKAGKLTLQEASDEKEENSWTLVENIKTLEKERDKLLGEIRELKIMARSKFNALRSEVTMLKEDEEVLKELLRILNHTTDQVRRLPKRNKTR